MTTFTASEVRDYLFSIEERSSRQWLIAHDAELGMLRQFADLLEAQERVVPMAWRIRVGSSNVWGYCESEHDADFLGKQSGLRYEKQPLYTHPVSADAERLAEALRDCIRDLRIAAEYGKTMRNPKALLETVERAEKALTAHSAQAQPPAARVTDAMVNAAMLADFCGHNVADALMCGTDWNTEVMRAALEAALAAQENPNEV